MPKHRVTKNDSEDLGFAITCLMMGVITRAEFTQWVYWVIETADTDLPHFFYTLDEFGPYPKDIYAATGFAPSTTLSRGEHDALAAIGYRRGTLAPRADSIAAGERPDPDTAAKALLRHPGVALRFDTAFPFLASGT